MDIDNILKQVEATEASESGFCIDRNGNRYSLTIGEASDAMQALLKQMSRRMAITWLKEQHHTSFPDLVLDDMSRRYSEKAMQMIPLVLLDIVKADLPIRE